MELKDVLGQNMKRLINVSYKNDYPVEMSEVSIKLAVEDSLTDFRVEKNEIFSTYERKFHSVDSKILIDITFQFRSKIKADVSITNQELIALIQKHENQYVLFAPSEASLIIANIMKSAGFPPVITAPTFIEKSNK